MKTKLLTRSQQMFLDEHLTALLVKDHLEEHLVMQGDIRIPRRITENANTLFKNYLTALNQEQRHEDGFHDNEDQD